MTLRYLTAEAKPLGTHAARLCDELIHAAQTRQHASVIILAAAVLDVALREPTGPAGDADGAAAIAMDAIYNFLINRGTQDHFDHVHRVLIRDTHAIDEFRFDIQSFQ